MCSDETPLSVGTRVVVVTDVRTSGPTRPKGTVAEVTRTPQRPDESYRVCFPDGVQSRVDRDDIAVLSAYQGIDWDRDGAPAETLRDSVFLECVVGSEAHGLSDEASDRDTRGIYLPPAEMDWSLWKLPEQLEDHTSDSVYWEISKFLRLALRASPNVLELLWAPEFIHIDAIGRALLDIREAFLSRLVYQSHMGYAMSQTRKLERQRERTGGYDPKDALHVIRLLRASRQMLERGTVAVEIDDDRDRFLVLKSGEMEWSDFDAWREQLVDRLERAYATSELPERPDYETANAFLVDARRSAVG